MYFLAANAPISHHLGADKGVELMTVDGQITTQTIEHFFSAILSPTVGDFSANL